MVKYHCNELDYSDSYYWNQRRAMQYYYTHYACKRISHNEKLFVHDSRTKYKATTLYYIHCPPPLIILNYTILPYNFHKFDKLLMKILGVWFPFHLKSLYMLCECALILAKIVISCIRTIRPVQ